MCLVSGGSEVSAVGKKTEDLFESACVWLLWCVWLVPCVCGAVCGVCFVSWWTVCVLWLRCLVLVVVVSLLGWRIVVWLVGIVAGVAVVEAAASVRGVPAWVVPRYRCVLWVGLVISDCFSGS